MGHDPRRRYYVVTVMRPADETPDECDQRIADQLGVTFGSSRVTVTVYEVAQNEFHQIKPANN